MTNFLKKLSSKKFLITYVGMLGLHIVEDSIWIGAARYTNVPIFTIFMGVLIWALIASIWARRGEDK